MCVTKLADAVAGMATLVALAMALTVVPALQALTMTLKVDDVTIVDS